LFDVISFSYRDSLHDGEWKIRTNREVQELNKGENIVKWIKGQRIIWLGHLERMEEDAQKDLHSRTGRDETKRKTLERTERRSGKRSSSVGSEKIERVGDRQGQMERYFSTGQSPQRAVAPTEEEEDSLREVNFVSLQKGAKCDRRHFC